MTFTNLFFIFFLLNPPNRGRPFFELLLYDVHARQEDPPIFFLHTYPPAPSPHPPPNLLQLRVKRRHNGGAVCLFTESRAEHSGHYNSPQVDPSTGVVVFTAAVHPHPRAQNKLDGRRGEHVSTAERKKAFQDRRSIESSRKRESRVNERTKERSTTKKSPEKSRMKQKFCATRAHRKVRYDI